jgi:hypothetical protein
MWRDATAPPRPLALWRVGSIPSACYSHSARGIKLISGGRIWGLTTAVAAYASKGASLHRGPVGFSSLFVFLRIGVARLHPESDFGQQNLYPDGT